MADEPQASAYEQKRLANMARNAAIMKSLGLETTPARAEKKKPTAPRPKKRQAATAAPSRRSVRARKPVATYSDEHRGGASNDDDDDGDDSGGGGESEYEDGGKDSEGEDQQEPSHQRRRATKPSPRGAPTLRPQRVVPAEELGGLVCEAAKTGRSTCRKCGERIEQGAARVGMKSWIVGRQALTWQHAACFLENLVCARDATGRTRCKVTGEPFARGELKLGARSHSATSYYKPTRAGAGAVLAAVVALVPRAAHARVKQDVLRVDRLDGAGELDASESDALGSVLRGAVAAMEASGAAGRSGGSGGDGSDGSDGEADGAQAGEEAKEGASGGTKARPGTAGAVASQPGVGVKSRTKGQVQWKWGSMVCSGALLPARETDTHCFARTHKGNTKTLAKGKPYWAMVG